MTISPTDNLNNPPHGKPQPNPVNIIISFPDYQNKPDDQNLLAMLEMRYD
jgi:hypothetical protein